MKGFNWSTRPNEQFCIEEVHHVILHLNITGKNLRLRPILEAFLLVLHLPRGLCPRKVKCHWYVRGTKLQENFQTNEKDIYGTQANESFVHTGDKWWPARCLVKICMITAVSWMLGEYAPTEVPLICKLECLGMLLFPYF